MSCSFCNSPNHNITQCTSTEIDILFDRIKTIYLEIVLNSPEISQSSRFKLNLNRYFNLRQLRGVGAKFMNTASRTPKVVLVNIIWEHLKNSIPTPLHDSGRSNPRELEGNDLRWFMGSTIPSFLSSSFLVWNSDFVGQSQQLYSPSLRMTGEYIDLGSGMVSEQGTQKYNIVTELTELVLDSVEEVECECSICYENIKCMNLVKLNCAHEFCADCIKGSLNACNSGQGMPKCALCREQIIRFSVKTPHVYNLVSEHCN